MGTSAGRARAADSLEQTIFLTKSAEVAPTPGIPDKRSGIHTHEGQRHLLV
ncbi:hypothetical protein GLW04_14965 [Halobacillus litoralis]|uniref:Uncharacterized protein n=1 Tax=Halobacillus litoralis TaxID=45668 RepID=A0A845DU77_9BACI|nr:hypothetical protein [Halobacillus litoralis]MYL21201.1 hypothetical protein [Halobacillus litoralis]